MPVQDDARENQMVQLFNLTVPDDRTRADIDAHLILDGRTIDFELKSSSTGSVSTVRDFGPDHIRKWRADLHWIFAFYDAGGSRLKYCVYASPADMEPWIAAKEEYVRPDLELADGLPAKVGAETVFKLLGEKDTYTRGDARWIMKRQWSESDYREFADVGEEYSLERMVQILRLRARYVILRGATLNNPHIERSFFDRFDRIEDEHAARLRDLVRGYFNASATEDATA